jgi:hypothetical protein
MQDVMLKADPWFINLIALGGAVYFLYSARQILTDLKDEIRDLKDTIRSIFEKHDDHERRISHLEGMLKGRRAGEAAVDATPGA